MWKNIVARQATDGNTSIGHAHCKHTVQVCNTHCFSAAAMVLEHPSLLRCTYEYVSCLLVSCILTLFPVLRLMDLDYTVISYFIKIYSSVGIMTRPRTGRAAVFFLLCHFFTAVPPITWRGSTVTPSHSECCAGKLVDQVQFCTVRYWSVCIYIL
jgi:hypothetical protein